MASFDSNNLSDLLANLAAFSKFPSFRNFSANLRHFVASSRLYSITNNLWGQGQGHTPTQKTLLFIYSEDNKIHFQFLFPLSWYFSVAKTSVLSDFYFVQNRLFIVFSLQFVNAKIKVVHQESSVAILFNNCQLILFSEKIN